MKPVVHNCILRDSLTDDFVSQNFILVAQATSGAQIACHYRST